MDFPNLAIEFDRDGHLHEPAIAEPKLAGFPEAGVTDLMVIAHGWNNDIADATQLYEAFFASARRVLDAGQPPPLASGQRRLAVLTVFWPSKRFTDEELIPGGGLASTAGTDENASVLRQLDHLKDAPSRLGLRTVDPVRAEILEQAKALVPRLDVSASARREFVFLLRSILDPAHAHPEDGTDDFFTADPEDLFRSLSEPVGAIPAAAGGADVGGGLAGGAATGGVAAGPRREAAMDGGMAGLVGDFFDGMQGAARRLLNFATYYEMKERAGVVGRGLAPVLRGIRQGRGVKIHLIGHSFGGRLVTAAAHALPDDTTVASVTLLQAAYSHNGLADKFDTRRDGFFRTVLTRRRVTGPICITHTRNDKAVGIAYPLAARVARDPLASLAALGDADDPYGGMGRNGAQHTPELVGGDTLHLRAVGQPLRLEPGKVHNYNGDACIRGHSDICGEPTVYLTLAAAVST
jgi:hypothetical protein